VELDQASNLARCDKIGIIPLERGRVR